MAHPPLDRPVDENSTCSQGVLLAHQLIIFDCDGVLVDSERIAARVDARLLRDLGWPIDEAEVIERFLGRSERDFVDGVETRLGRRLPEGWELTRVRLYREAFAAELKPVDGVREALDQIAAPSCVASSGTHEKIRCTLSLTGLYERFRGRIFSAADVRNGKPAPDLFLYAAQRLRAEPEACAVVEDSRLGVQAARAAGMRVFAYCGGVTPPERLAGPHTVLFDDMRALPGLLRESRA